MWIFGISDAHFVFPHACRNQLSPVTLWGVNWNSNSQSIFTLKEKSHDFLCSACATSPTEDAAGKPSLQENHSILWKMKQNEVPEDSEGP